MNDGNHKYTAKSGKQPRFLLHDLLPRVQRDGNISKRYKNFGILQTNQASVGQRCPALRSLMVCLYRAPCHSFSHPGHFTITKALNQRMGGIDMMRKEKEGQHMTAERGRFIRVRRVHQRLNLNIQKAHTFHRKGVTGENRQLWFWFERMDGAGFVPRFSSALTDM